MLNQSENTVRKTFDAFIEKFMKCWYRAVPCSVVSIDNRCHIDETMIIRVNWYVCGKEYHCNKLIHYGEFEMIRGIDGVLEHTIKTLYNEYNMSLLGKAVNYDNDN